MAVEESGAPTATSCPITSSIPSPMKTKETVPVLRWAHNSPKIANFEYKNDYICKNLKIDFSFVSANPEAYM